MLRAEEPNRRTSLISPGMRSGRAKHKPVVDMGALVHELYGLSRGSTPAHRHRGTGASPGKARSSDHHSGSDSEQDDRLATQVELAGLVADLECRPREVRYDSPKVLIG